MKLKTILFCLLVLSVAAPYRAHGQFWKKWFQKEEKARPKPVQKPKSKAAETPAKKKRRTLEYPASKIKSRYRVDVLLPLYLDELVKNNKPVYKDKLPEKAITGTAFYEGVKLAADSLSALGYNVDLFIHDITENGFAPDELVKGNVLEETDLIIGVLQSPQIPTLANFAKQKNINLISVLSPADADVKDNLFFTMLQPTLEKHCEKLKEYAFKKHSDQNLLLFYRNSNATDSSAAGHILSGNEQTFRKFLLNKPMQKGQVERLLDSTLTNVIFMPLVDNGFAESVLQQLSSWFPRYQFEVYGMPSWKFIANLRKADAYPNIGVNFTSPFYYDFTTGIAQVVASNHKKQFGGKISEMVLRGYEVLYWYTYLLQKYGTVYNTKQSDNAAAAFTKFEVKPQWNKQQELLYNENEHLFLYRYQSGSFLVNNL